MGRSPDPDAARIPARAGLAIGFPDATRPRPAFFENSMIPRMSSAPISSDTLLGRLRWRYATKKFDPARKISDGDWAALEEALILSPSSYGMQPYQMIVITDPAMKERLVPHSWNQRQPADCSHYVVFAARAQNTEADIDRFLQRTAEVRGGAIDALAGFKKMLMADVVHGPRGREALVWSTNQAYIALGNLMTSAALVGIDTCPMEGFLPDRYDEILDLPARGMRAVVACAAGYRADEDPYAGAVKVRLAPADLILRI